MFAPRSSTVPACCAHQLTAPCSGVHDTVDDVRRQVRDIRDLGHCRTGAACVAARSASFTPGRYNSLLPMYYRGCHVALIVYDITSGDSFKRAKNWIKEMQVRARPVSPARRRAGSNRKCRM